MRRFITKKSLLVACGGLCFFVASVACANYITVQRYSSYIVEPGTIQDTKIGIVFGGGITDTEPLPLLKDRLDAAKNLLDSGNINSLLLSGDNRTLDYNEPRIMYQYLIETGVSEDKLQQDFAGRSTYETCERAKKIFGLSKVILLSERTHLPRAIYLCRHFGLDAIGIATDGDAASGLQIGQRWREVLASNKAIFNTFIAGEQTVLGEKINILTF